MTGAGELVILHSFLRGQGRGHERPGLRNCLDLLLKTEVTALGVEEGPGLTAK